MYKFKADIEIIGINPFVFIPDKILKGIFRQAGRDKGHIPVRGEVNGSPFKQTLVKYKSAWRFYINTGMLKNSPRRIGETIAVTIEFDPEDRIIPVHPKLQKALNTNPKAKLVFERLSPSRRKEIVRYINFLKTETSVDKNVARVIRVLARKENLVGRKKP